MKFSDLSKKLITGGGGVICGRGGVRRSSGFIPEVGERSLVTVCVATRTSLQKDVAWA